MSAAKRRTNYAAALDRSAASTPKPGVTAIRTRPVRITVDMSPELHGQMKNWTRQNAAALGRDLALAEVVRELAQLMLTDEKLAAKIRKQLSNQQK